MFKKLSDFTNFKKRLNEKNTKEPQPLIAPSEPKIAEPATKPSINPFKPGKRDPKESPKPKAYKLISEVLNEAMSHKRHSDIDKSLKSKTHSLAKNPAYPNEDFDKIIADERFKEIVDKLQSYVHDKHIDIENMMDLQMLLMKVYNEVVEIEADHIEDLEKLAIDLICKEFNISEDDVDFEAKMIKHGEISLSDIDDEDAEEIADDLTGLELEVEKRKFINSLIHGSAVKTTYAYHLISDGLKKIHPGLVDMYSILSVMSEYGYWVVPDNFGGEESSVGKIKLDLQDDTPKIIVTATSFPFLIHELAKGVTELLMSHDSLSSEERTKVIKAADSLASERMALRLGPGFWQRLNDAIYDSRNEEYKNNIIAVLSSKPAKEFNAIMKNILSGDKNATKEINDIVKDIKHDIAQNKLGESKIITNFKQFVNENLLVPRNLEGRKEKLKQINIKLLSQEVIDGELKLDESFMDIDPKFVKLKKVNGDVWLTGEQWTEIPAWLKDVEVNGDFNCYNNKLTTLKNCPRKIGGDFGCSYNDLTSLEGSPDNINGSFQCYNNKLTSLQGCPEYIGGNFSCTSNELTTLEGCPENVGGDFYCQNNKGELELPNYVKLKGQFKN